MLIGYEIAEQSTASDGMPFAYIDFAIFSHGDGGSLNGTACSSMLRNTSFAALRADEITERGY